MIVFDLVCEGSGHRFEAWFGSSDDYQAQQARRLIQCPVCDDDRIIKAVMAPAVAPKGNRGLSPSSGPDLAAVKARILAECDDVGPRFAEEALARHEAQARGEAARGCFGEATMAEAASLVAEGVPVAPLPFRPPGRHDA